MNISEIQTRKTDLDIKEIKKMAVSELSGVHESVFRAHHIVSYIKRFLVANPKIEDTTILLELIAFMEERNEQYTR